MKIFRAKVFVAVVVLAAAGTSRAQNLSLVWSEWDTSAVQKQGPELADGILLYFHRWSSGDATKEPIPSIFVEMAKVANWDILRINRHPFVDGEQSDGDVFQVVADRIARARQQGYKKVILGGGERGGWLALSAAALPGVDAAIGLAPGRAFGRTQLMLARDILANRLAHVGATRIAVFFFEGDRVEQLEERRSVAIWRALEQSSATFMIVDHPPGLHGPNAMWMGRLARRYRDCLLWLIGEIGLPAGEVRCSPSMAMLAGADIGFPAPAGHRNYRCQSGFSTLSRPLGRRRRMGLLFNPGISVHGCGQHRVQSRLGRNGELWSAAEHGKVIFHLNGSDGSIVYKPDGGPGNLMARLLGTTELEVTLHGLTRMDR